MFVIWKHKRSQPDEPTRKKKVGKKKWVLPKDFLARVAGVDEGLKVYKFEELKAATEKFSSQNRLSSSVYRGILGGKTIAIKNMSTDVLKEVKILKKINHFNLISLYGLCEHHGISYLVYEFMENGSLKSWLSQKSCTEVNSWNNRIRIALDIANGLDYLHNFTDPAYVHQDINSCNVLLNKDLRAKIANFGLAKAAQKGESENSSMWCVITTRGYMAPEYLEFSKVTPKIDVYAFGVVLLELITGKEAVFEQDGEEVLLSEKILSIMDRRNADTEIEFLVDPRLQVKHPLGYIIDQTDLALRLVKLSVACLAEEPIKRLSMAKVVSTLMRIQFDALRSSEHLSME